MHMQLGVATRHSRFFGLWFAWSFYAGLRQLAQHILLAWSVVGLFAAEGHGAGRVDPSRAETLARVTGILRALSDLVPRHVVVERGAATAPARPTRDAGGRYRWLFSTTGERVVGDLRWLTNRHLEGSHSFVRADVTTGTTRAVFLLFVAKDRDLLVSEIGALELLNGNVVSAATLLVPPSDRLRTFYQGYGQ